VILNAKQAVLPRPGQLLDQGAMYGIDCSAEFRQTFDMLRRRPNHSDFQVAVRQPGCPSNSI